VQPARQRVCGQHVRPTCMMVLVLAIHSVSTVTAKVPFSMVALVDHIRRKDLPPELKCRQVRLRLQLAPQCRAQARAPALLRVLLCVCVLCGQCQSRLKRSQATLLKAGAALQVFPTSGGRSSTQAAVGASSTRHAFKRYRGTSTTEHKTSTCRRRAHASPPHTTLRHTHLAYLAPHRPAPLRVQGSSCQCI